MDALKSTLDAIRDHYRKNLKRTDREAVSNAHRAMYRAVDEMLNNFRMDFEVPGVRYFEIYLFPSLNRTWRSTFVSLVDMSEFGPEATYCELTYLEYMARQGVFTDFDESLPQKDEFDEGDEDDF